MYGVDVSLIIMVVPCLTCLHMDSHEYTYDKERDFYNYRIVCKLGVVLPDPVPKSGLTCDKYENKLASLPRVRRSSCAIEVVQSKK
ncbi:hypothetical protein SDC9_25328 [bioreactor metagenome]|uniref:Uncharacterized protein n=1 Tax=bioreactor metagenome TaxID=1076179 RepID=A0A644UKJ5_9ZZZZ